MPPVASSVLLEPILDGQLRGHTSDAAFMLFGPNGCAEHILVPLWFELALLLRLVKFVHFLCHNFGLRLVKFRLAIHYLRLPCLKPLAATFVKAFKRVGLPGGYYCFSFKPPLLELPLVSTRPKTNSMYVAQCKFSIPLA
jgi:hypothetical protein